MYSLCNLKAVDKQLFRRSQRNESYPLLTYQLILQAHSTHSNSSKIYEERSTIVLCILISCGLLD